MKRLILAIVAILSMVGTAFAHEHYIEQTGMTISVSDEHVMTRRATDSARIRLSDSDIGLFVHEFDEFEDFCGEDYRYLDEARLSEMLEVNSESVKTEVISADSLKIIKRYFYRDGALISAEYFTSIYGFEIEISVDNASGISPEIEAELDEIIGNIRFDDTLSEKQKRQLPRWEKKVRYEKSLRYGQIIVAAVLIPIVLVLSVIFIALHVRKRRENKARDAALSAKATCTCRACGAAMAEDAEVCSSCGTRQ